MSLESDLLHEGSQAQRTTLPNCMDMKCPEYQENRLVVAGDVG